MVAIIPIIIHCTLQRFKNLGNFALSFRLSNGINSSGKIVCCGSNRSDQTLTDLHFMDLLNLAVQVR